MMTAAWDPWRWKQGRKKAEQSAADSTIYSIEKKIHTNRQRKRCQDDGIGGDMSEIGGDT